MKDGESEINDLLLLEEREKSIRVSKNGREFWLPRSQITYLRKDPPMPNGQRTITIQIPDWLAEEKQLD